MNVGEARALFLEANEVCPKEWGRLFHKDEKKFFRFCNEWLTAACLVDFKYYLWYEVYWRSRKHYRSETQRRMADWLQRWKLRLKFSIVAREHTKTQMALAYQSWRFAQDVDRRLLIRANNSPKAQQIGRGLREILDSKAFQNRFPWVKAVTKAHGSQRELWGNDGIMLQRSDVGIRVPSVEMCGLEKDPTGGHFTDILGDDYAVEENERSAILREDLYNKFESDDALLLPGGRRLFNATIWQKDGFIDSAKNREGKFAGMDYDLFVQPAEVEAFPSPIVGTEVELLDDRVTFAVKDARFDGAASDLKYCQARITIPNPMLTDTDVLIREIVWNDVGHFRVNRVIPTIYMHAPSACTVGNMRPACPNRFTMDEVDLIPAEADKETVLERGSLPQKLRTQGPYTYGCQFRLNPLAKENLLFNAEKLQRISKAEFDEIAKKQAGAWYRFADLSSFKKTGSFTAFTYGFVSFQGVFARRLFWGLPKTDAIFKEIFAGIVWLQDMYGAALRYTHFEKAHIENTVVEQLPKISQDPYTYFSGYKEHAEFAEAALVNRGPIPVITKIDSRGNAGKMDRIAHNLQPVLEQERLYLVEGIEHYDRAVKELSEATLDKEIGFDLLETIADLCTVLRPERKTAVVEERRIQIGSYDHSVNEALRRQGMVGFNVGGYG